MRKIFNTLVGLIIVLAILVAGGALYLEKFLNDQAEFQISMLKDVGFDLSSYGDVTVDFSKQNVALTDVKVASSDKTQPVVTIAKIELIKVNPLSFSQMSADQLLISDYVFKQGDMVYQTALLEVANPVYYYPSSTQNPQIAQSNREKIQLMHQLIGYDKVTMQDYVLKGAAGKISKMDKLTFTKGGLINDLPNDIKLLIEGIKIDPSHLDLQTAQMLNAYNIQSLEGIVDLSFNYDQANKSGKISINNLYLGGLASLNGDTEFIMNDERFARFYEVGNYQNFIKTIPFNEAKLNYEDLGLYQYFIDNQSRLSGIAPEQLKSQLYFGIVVLAGQIQDLEMQKKLSEPLFKFHENPNQLKLLLQPKNPIRFEQYLNLYDLNGLTKDLNPSIQYL